MKEECSHPLKDQVNIGEVTIEIKLRFFRCRECGAILSAVIRNAMDATEMAKRILERLEHGEEKKKT